MEKLILIDGNSLINRAFYAMPLLSTKDGTPVNAVYGFMNMFFKLLDDFKPTHVACAFDLKAPTFRHKLYPEYKGTRRPMPEELRPQIPLLKDLLGTMGVAVLSKEGSEADDIIGTLAKSADVDTVIVTGDKDSFQLVDEHTSVLFTKRGITETELYTAENFTEKTSLSPNQIIELKALMGDSSDNIPGVPGVGEKTAISLLLTYGNVDTLYEHTDELKGKLQEKVIANKDLAYLSRTLATIDLSCGIDTDLEKTRFSLPLSDQVKKRFVELEFKSLYTRAALFGDAEGENNSETQKKVPVIKILDGEALRAVDLSRVISVTFIDGNFNLFDGETEFAIPERKTLLDEGLPVSETFETLKPLFTGAAKLVVFDKKEMRHALNDQAGYDLAAPVDDVALMKYLAEFEGGAEKLSDVLTYYDKDLSSPASALYDVFVFLRDKLKEEDMQTLYETLELPLADVLYNMEVRGFKADADALNIAGEQYKEVLCALEAEIRALTDEPDLNVNSPKQLGDALFGKLKIGKGKKTKKGYSTNAEVLEALETAHPVVPVILRYRRVQKLYSTYIEGFKPLIDKTTGLIHTSFNQTVTSTGRLSSKEPNLQNIPVRDDEGKELRKFFVPRSEDRILVSADYSQIELRLLAAFSGCKGLIDAFNRQEDVHSATAAKVFNVPVSQVTDAMRGKAKAVNFGIVYGMSEYGLAKNLKISAAEARRYIDAYFKQYPEVKAYMESNVETARKNGYAQTILGRRRYIKELQSSNFSLRGFGERAAMNMPLQGSSADIIKLAMIGVENQLKERNLKSQLILQIHDELIIDAYKSEYEEVKSLLAEQMQNAVQLSVPLTVSVKSGKNWFEAK